MCIIDIILVEMLVPIITFYNNLVLLVVALIVCGIPGAVCITTS